MLPEEEPSRLDAIIQELKVCQNMWRTAIVQAKQSGLTASQLEEEVNLLRETKEGV